MVTLFPPPQKTLGVKIFCEGLTGSPLHRGYRVSCIDT
jgi:hypothetical protein